MVMTLSGRLSNWIRIIRLLRHCCCLENVWGFSMYMIIFVKYNIRWFLNQAQKWRIIFENAHVKRSITDGNFLNVSPSAMRFVISRTEISHSPDPLGLWGWKSSGNKLWLSLVSDTCCGRCCSWFHSCIVRWGCFSSYISKTICRFGT